MYPFRLPAQTELGGQVLAVLRHGSPAHAEPLGNGTHPKTGNGQMQHITLAWSERVVRIQPHTHTEAAGSCLPHGLHNREGAGMLRQEGSGTLLGKGGDLRHIAATAQNDEPRPRRTLMNALHQLGGAPIEQLGINQQDVWL